MSRRDPNILLGDILSALDRIGRYTEGMDKSRFLADERTQDAVVRNLEIVGEAVRQLPDSFKNAHAQIPWWQIAGMRNRIVHDYFGVDAEIIWQVASESAPTLKRQIVDLTDRE
jgi:hypothetical protein